MPAKQQLSELAERRRLLVLEAELHRSLLGLERENLRAQLAGFQAVREKVQAASPLLMVGAAAVGLLAFRHRRKFSGWLSALPAVFHLIRFWRAASSRRAS